jgi:hypothetical protein
LRGKEPGPNVRQINTQAVLEAMDGIAIQIGSDLEVIAYGAANWNRFWQANGGAAGYPDPRGRPITEHFSSGEVRDTLERLFHDVVAQRRTALRFDYRCDAPEVRRDMRLSVTPVQVDGSVCGLLYQSITLSSLPRPAIGLFAAGVVGSDVTALKMCSICARLAWPPGDDSGPQGWVEALEYYRRGGEEVTLLSHGLCERCFDALNADVD